MNKSTLKKNRSSFLTTCLTLFAFLFVALNSHAQPWTYDFGTGTGTHTSNTASTSFLPTPSSGTARVRVGTNPGSIVMANSGLSALGTNTELQITSNTNSTSTTKFSIHDYTAGKTGYVKFYISFSGGTNGVYKFSIGNGATFSDNNAMSTSQIFSGIQWTFGASNSITYNVLNGGTYGTTGISNSTSQFIQSTSTVYLVEVYANNTTASSSYHRNGVIYSLTNATWDLWVDGTRVGTGLAKGNLAVDTDIDSYAFNHQNSASAPGTIYLDDIEYSNSLPAVFYSASSGNLENVVNWGSNTDGTGTAPSDFTSNNQVFNIRNNVTPTIGANWTVSGTNSKVIVGDGTNACNFTIPASTTVTAAMDISASGTLTMADNSTLTGGGNVVIKSNSTGTGRIGTMGTGASISGNVTTETYIPSGRRAYRFLGHPFSSALNLGSLTDDIYVTGAGGAANGFNATTTNSPSAYWFDNTAGGTGSWTAFTHGSTDNSWTQYRGIRALVRGDKTQTGTLDGTNPTPNAVTIDMTGTVNTGNQDIPVLTAGAYHLVSNPYPSPTDIGSVINTASANLGIQYWVWNANSATKGAYVTLSTTGGAYNLAMNGAFVVLPTTGTSLAFTEANKTSSATASLYQTDNANELLQIQLQYEGRHADNMFVRFDKDYKNDFDNKDGEKLLNPDINFYSTTVDGKKLSFDSRPFAKEGIIPITLTSTLQSPFKFVVLENGIEPGIEVYLKDKLLNTLTKLVAGAVYDFEVTADANTQGANRFELVMQKAPEVMAPVTNLTVQVGPNPASQFIKVTMAAPKAEATSLRIVNTDGKAVSNMNLGTVSHIQKDISIQQLPAGTYVVQVTHGAELITKKIVKQ